MAEQYHLNTSIPSPHFVNAPSSSVQNASKPIRSFAVPASLSTPKDYSPSPFKPFFDKWKTKQRDIPTCLDPETIEVLKNSGVTYVQQTSQILGDSDKERFYAQQLENCFRTSLRSAGGINLNLTDSLRAKSV